MITDLRILDPGHLEYREASYHVSARFDLLLIQWAWAAGLNLEHLADGFGPGQGTKGDWSAIRDSSPKAIERMAEAALNFIRDVLRQHRERGAKNPSAYSAQARAFLGQEIPRLIERGMPQRQAVAAALSQARRRGLKVPPAENPGVLALVNPANPGARFGDAVYEIRYRHSADGADYVHTFEHPDSVTLWARSPYQVVLVGEQPIVEEFR
jgi:hypothetical protein